MNRSRYIPPAGYPVHPYHPQQYGAVPPHPSQMAGMMQSPPLGMSASPYNSPPLGMGSSPVPGALSPQAMWTATFANGPIIEDLCAPPPPHMAMHPHHHPSMHGMTMAPPAAAMHPGAMPQVQNVFGIRQPTPHPFAPQHTLLHPGQQHGMPMHGGGGGAGMPAARVVGAYPPYVAMQQQQQQQHMYAPPPPRQMHLDPSAMLAQPRMEMVFPTAGQGHGRSASGMGQMGSPDLGAGAGSPGEAGMQPLTPVEEALRGFLSPDLSDLGHH